jgi:hypothetical protein
VGEQIGRADLASAAEQLRRVLASVPADLDHAAYLRGAADTLAMLAARADGSEECPETKELGPTGRREHDGGRLNRRRAGIRDVGERLGDLDGLRRGHDRAHSGIGVK